MRLGKFGVDNSRIKGVMALGNYIVYTMYRDFCLSAATTYRWFEGF